VVGRWRFQRAKAKQRNTEIILAKRILFVMPRMSAVAAAVSAAILGSTRASRVGDGTRAVANFRDPCYRIDMEIKLTAVFRKFPEGYAAFVEELPGANTQGATLEEARANLKEAVEMVLQANRELALN